MLQPPKKQVIRVKLLDENRKSVGVYDIPAFERVPEFLIHACRLFQRESIGIYVQRLHFMIPHYLDPVTNEGPQNKTAKP